MNQYIQQHQGELERVPEFFKRELSAIRTGRANPAMLDNVVVEAYGAKLPLQQVGTITVVDARCLLIIPWDKGTLKAIEKSIVDANLGVNPVNEGDKIRISLPQPTEEDRKNQVKKLNEKFEQSRILLRRVRDKIKSAITAAESDKAMSEDDKFRFEKEMEEEIKKQQAGLEEIRQRKEKEIMTI